MKITESESKPALYSDVLLECVQGFLSPKNTFAAPGKRAFTFHNCQCPAVFYRALPGT